MERARARRRPPALRPRAVRAAHAAPGTSADGRAPGPRAGGGHRAGRGLPALRLPPGAASWGWRATCSTTSAGCWWRWRAPRRRSSVPGAAARRGAAAGVGGAGRRPRASRRPAAAGFEIVASERRGRARLALGLARRGHLRRLPARAVRPRRPPLPLPVHQLHQLRAALHDRARRALRPAARPRWPASRCAPPAGPSTTTPPTAASTPSRTRARTAGRGVADRLRRGRRELVDRWPRRSPRCARGDRGGQGAGRLPPGLPRRRRARPSPRCARASTGRTSRSR